MWQWTLLKPNLTEKLKRISYNALDSISTVDSYNSFNSQYSKIGSFCQLDIWIFCYFSVLFINIIYRAGNSLISFLSESLVFCEKISGLAIRSKKQAIRSFLVSDLSDLLMVAHFW